MRLYATAADAWGTDTPPANADVLLRAASRAVDLLLRGRKYDVDADGLPTDADHLQALRDAAVAIALEAQATGALDPGATNAWDSVGIGNVSLSGRKVTEGATILAGVPIPPAAVIHLADVGTSWVSVW